MELWRYFRVLSFLPAALFCLFPQATRAQGIPLPDGNGPVSAPVNGPGSAVPAPPMDGLERRGINPFPDPNRVPVPVKDTAGSPTFRLRHHERAKPTPAPTPPPPPARPYVRRWTLEAGPVLDWPSSRWNPAYGVGGGIGVEAGYALDGNWFLGAGFEDIGYSGTVFGNSFSNQYLAVHLTVRYFFGSQGIRPYLTALAGGAWQYSTAYGQAVENFEPALAAGAGVELGLSPALFLYAEARLDFILLPDGTALDVPFLSGLGLKL